MKLADLSNGPDWIVWAVFIVITILSVVLISGHGSGLVSGYNMATKEEKAKYNEKRLCWKPFGNIKIKNEESQNKKRY